MTDSPNLGLLKPGQRVLIDWQGTLVEATVISDSKDVLEVI